MIKFKQITAIAASALIAGLTMGTAVAANYPAPFVTSGAADVAVVYGTGAGVSQLDAQGAGQIQTNLNTFVTSAGTGSSVSGGDFYKLEKASTKFQYGLGMDDVDASALDDKELPNLLKDSVFTDNDNDEFDYKQSVLLNNNTLGLFDDDEYKVDSPTVGFSIADGTNVLNYTLDFTENPLWVDLDTADLKIMDKVYYVLSATANNSLTLLDSAVDTEINEGETKTVTVGTTSYEVSAKITSSNEVKLTVNGVATNSLGEGETQNLGGSAYVGIKDIMYNAKDSGISSVEFSIGKGKLVLTNGAEVEINDEDVDNLVVAFTNASSDANKIDTIIFKWAADNDMFITEDTAITMPGFETIKISFGGMVYPATETIVLKADGDDKIMLKDFQTKESAVNLYLINGDGGNYSLIGKDSNNKLATGAQTGYINFTEGVHDMFVLTYISGDEGESYLVRASNFDDTDWATLEQVVDFEYLVDGTWKDLDNAVNASEEVSIGSAAFTVDWVSNETAKTVNLSVSGSNTFKKIVSKEGLQVILPWTNSSTQNSSLLGPIADLATACTNASGLAGVGAGAMGNYNIVFNLTAAPTVYTAGVCNATSYIVQFDEEDKDDAIAGGPGFNVTVGLDTDLEVTISSIAGDTTAYEMGETEVYRSFVASALATEIKDDQSGDHETVTIIYHGGESYGDVYVTAPTAAVSTGVTQLGAVLAKDSEMDKFQAKNLVVVGGSCINAVAAKLLGSTTPICGPAFTAKTQIGAGEAIIKAYASPYAASKTAIMVAGYEASDTSAAVTYLTTKTVDTSSAYKVKSATEAIAIAA